MTAAAPPLAPDLVAGLRRLKLAAIRQIAPELLITAKTQRTIQEVRFYVSDVVAFIERVCDYAKEQNIRVVS